MKLAFQRRVDRIAGTFICRILSLFSFLGKDPPESKTPQKVLAILLSEMGALVLAQPMFERVKEKYPQASLYALLFQQNKEVLDLLEVIPKQNILTVRNDTFFHLLLDSVRAIWQMRRIGVDTVLDCELFSRISSIFSFLSGAQIRAGFHPHTQEGLFRGNFVNRPVLYNPYQHISHQFLTLVEAIESTALPRVKRPVVDQRLSLPRMRLGPDEISTMSRRLESDFPHVAGKRIVLVYPGGGLLPIRAWPLPYFCQLAKDLVGRGYGVGIIGLKRDKEAAREILAFCDSSSCIDLTGYTETVRELTLLFHLASLLITNDGGPGHFAALTPIPAIILYGPETPTLYGSLDDKSVNLYTHLSCSPCLTAYNHRNSPCDGDNVCLKSILPDVVLQKSCELLEGEKAIVTGDA
jgi:ADP-heptose:LPS heptosyltransferase